jgi:hypothetical protein
MAAKVNASQGVYIVAQQEIGTPIYAREIRESLVQPRPFLVSHTPFLLSRQKRS